MIMKTVFLLGVAAAALLQLWPEAPGVCGHDTEVCFFAENYHGARARFRELAARAGGSVEVLRVSQSPDLTIDVAVLPAAGGTAAADGPVLVHMSGTHGVEAYAGSAIQLALLHKWAEAPEESPASRGVKVVLVHAVNPHGFHCGRRFNEDNVDLNRNVLSDAEFEQLAHADPARRKLYDDHSWLFNWNRAWTPYMDDALFIARAIYGIAALGMVNVKRAIVAGQYHQPDGLYYGGGPQLTRSHALLLPLLKRVAAPAFAAILLDVHTGLGPMGVDTLMPPLSGGVIGDAENAAAVDAIFGTGAAGADVLGTDFLIGAKPEDAKGAAAASSGYELTRGSTDNYLLHLAGADGWARALQVTQEFGTWPAPLVLYGMIVERAEWLHGEPALGSECNGTARGAKAAKDAFYVRRASWQRKIVRRGRALAEQAVAALAARPSVVPEMVQGGNK